MAGMLVSGVVWGGFVYKWSHLGFQNFPAEKGFWFAGEGNPPSATLVCYSLLTLFLMYFGYQVLESCAGLEYRVLNRCAAAVQLILSPVRFWGRHSMDIFLYHLLAQWVYDFRFAALQSEFLWCYRIGLVVVMMFVPVWIHMVCKKTWKWLMG